jgi:predicted glycogen debranching enzyme
MTALRLGRDRLGAPEVAGTLEWLVTNGIGGYACGTVGGILARRYHGLLVAALKPPVGRTLMLAKLAETIEIDGTPVDLDANRWAGGVAQAPGLAHLESFALEGSVPVWTYAIGDTRLEKRVWMEQGENTTYVQYRSTSARGPVTLRLKALVNHRDAHLTRPRGEGAARVEPAAGGLKIQVDENAEPLWLFASGAEAAPAHDWYRGFALALEEERGLDALEDHLMAGTFTAALAPGEALTVVASTRHDAGRGGAGPLALAGALARRHAHDHSLLEAWRKAHPPAARQAPGWIEALVLAADQFIVERSLPGLPQGRSVIAGYPWFSDWGRDTMIAAPGLTLATGRPEIARMILSTLVRHLDRGMLPNYFPDQGEPPTYNAVDSALWLFQAVRAYHEATGDDAFLAEVYPALEEVCAWYERGTRYGIHVDERDALVDAGEAGVQLTWMDAKVDDWVVTPRQGKAVEINALWYNALTALGHLGHRLGRDTEPYARLARRVEESFGRFWNESTQALYDVVDGPEGPDPSLRPNMLFAVSLPDSPLPLARRRAVLEACGRLLLTSYGLRSLSPTEVAYRGRFTGDRRSRDGAYHQGTAWPWLSPHYALAHFRVHADRDAALAMLAPLGDLISQMAVGTLPEVVEGDPPHRPKGCFAQAWSVAEALRVWHLLVEVKPPQAARPRPAARRVTAGARPA